MVQRVVTQGRPGFLRAGMAKKREAAVGWAKPWSFGGAVCWEDVVKLAERQLWVVEQGL